MRAPTQKEREYIQKVESSMIFQSLLQLFALVGMAMTWAWLLVLVSGEQNFDPLNFQYAFPLVFGGILIGVGISTMLMGDNNA